MGIQFSEGTMHKFLEYASEQYYEGNPVISDAEFDRLSQMCGYNNVGYSVTDGISHLIQMYSLQKVFSEEELPSNIEDYVCTPKLDGAAVSLLYLQGELTLGLTRGDGKIGKDITDKMSLLVPDPLCIWPTVLQITGEIVAPSDIPNARNFAAGSLNLKDLEEFKSRPLTFVAYDMQIPDGLPAGKYLNTLEILRQDGFNTVDTFDASKYPTDGYVYRLISNIEYVRLGFTSHHPRGAVALKEQKEGVLTKLLDVVWQVGKSGVVSPVAELEPVDIDGAIVRRATLHNIEYIRALNLEIGCGVEVIRSGDIIPRIVNRVDY